MRKFISHPAAFYSPLLVGMLLCVISWCSLPGYYVPDTTAFLQETASFGQPDEWHTTPPIYPMFLNAVGNMFPSSARIPVIVAIQLVAGVLLPTLAFLLIGRLSRHPVAGWVAAWISILYGPSYLLAHTTQTESLFVGFTSLVALFATPLLFDRPIRPSLRFGLAALCGILASVAIGQRTVGLAILLWLPLVLLFFPRPRKQSLLTVLTFLATAAVGISILCLRNHNHFGESSLVRGKGIHLWNRVCYDYEVFPPSTESQRAISIARSHGVEDPSAENVGWSVFPALVYDEGFSKKEADRLMTTAARKALLKNPAKTLRETTKAMAHAARINPPFNEYGVLFMAGGIRSEHFQPHLENAEFWWKSDLPKLNAARAAFPPYPTRSWLGSWPLTLFESLSSLGNIWCGWWSLVIASAGIVVGFARKKPILTLTFGLALSLLATSAMGEMPQIRFWVTSVPFYFLGVIFLIAELSSSLFGSSRT